MMEALTDSTASPSYLDYTLESDNESVRSVCCQFTNGRVRKKPRSRQRAGTTA